MLNMNYESLFLCFWFIHVVKKNVCSFQPEPEPADSPSLATKMGESAVSASLHLLDITGLPLNPGKVLQEALHKIEDTAATTTSSTTTPSTTTSTTTTTTPAPLDLSTYDSLYLCHTALTARVRRGAATTEVLSACRSQRQEYRRRAERLEQERARLVNHVAELKKHVANGQEMDPCEEVATLSQQLAAANEQLWATKEELSHCTNEKNTKSALLKVVQSTTESSTESQIPMTTDAVPMGTRSPRSVTSSTTEEERTTSTTPSPIEINYQPYADDVWISDVNDKAINFRHRGEMLASVTYVHLVVDVDIRKLRKQGKQVCDIFTHEIKHNSTRMNAYLDDFVKRLGLECQSMLTRLDEEYVLWFQGTEKLRGSMQQRNRKEVEKQNAEIEPVRKKRQVIVGALVLTGILAIGSYLFSKVAMASVSVQAFTSPVTIRTLQDHETRISIDERSIELLNKTVAKMLYAEEQLHAEMAKLDLVMRSEHYFYEIRRKVDNTIRGIQKIHNGKLSPELVDPRQLVNIVNSMEASLSTVGLKLAATDMEYLFDAPTSFLLFQNETVRSIVHLVAHREEAVLTLLEFLPAPYSVSPTHFLEIQPEAAFLAISKDTQIFQSLTSSDLTLCRDVGRPPLSYCQGSNVVKRRGYESCLFALYDRDTHKIKEYCNVRFVAKEDRVIQLSHNEMILFHHTESVARFTCEMHHDRDRQISFQGFKRLRLQPGCTVTTEKFKLQGSTEVFVHSEVNVDDRTIDLSSFNLDELRDKWSFSVHDLALVGSAEGLKIKDIHKLYEDEDTAMAWTIGIVTGLALLLVGAGILWCWCCGCKCCRCPKIGRSGSRPPPIEIEMRSAHHAYSSSDERSQQQQRVRKRKRKTGNTERRPSPSAPMPTDDLVMIPMKSLNTKRNSVSSPYENPAKTYNILYPSN